MRSSFKAEIDVDSLAGEKDKYSLQSSTQEADVQRLRTERRSLT